MRCKYPKEARIYKFCIACADKNTCGDVVISNVTDTDLSKLPKTDCDIPMPDVNKPNLTKFRKCSGKYMVYENHKYKEKAFDLGYFHCWGSGYEWFYEADLGLGVGNYTTAIVELPDGKIITPNAEGIQFLEPIGK